jgi:hypothetical protein
MSTKLKIIGLTLTAFIVMGVAAPVSMAQQGVFTSTGPVTLLGAETGESANRITAFGAFFECPGSTYTTHKVATTPHVLVPISATSATMRGIPKEITGSGAPNCKGSLGTSATIDMNGCDYVITLGQTTGGVPGTYGMKLHLVCPAGKEITITVWLSEAAHTSEPNTPKCILHLPPQNERTGPHFSDTGNGSLDLTGTVTSVTVKQTRNSILCPSGTHTSGGSIHFDVNFTGRNETGSATPVSVSDVF